MIQNGRKEDVCEPKGRRFSVSLKDRRAGPASQWEGEALLLWELTGFQLLQGPKRKGSEATSERPGRTMLS